MNRSRSASNSQQEAASSLNGSSTPTAHRYMTRAVTSLQLRNDRTVRQFYDSDTVRQKKNSIRATTIRKNVVRAETADTETVSAKRARFSTSRAGRDETEWEVKQEVEDLEDKRRRQEQLERKNEEARILRNALEGRFDCSICLSTLHKPLQPDTCRHVFCSFCIYQALENSRQCPTCKTHVRRLVQPCVHFMKLVDHFIQINPELQLPANVVAERAQKVAQLKAAFEARRQGMRRANNADARHILLLDDILREMENGLALQRESWNIIDDIRRHTVSGLLPTPSNNLQWLQEITRNIENLVSSLTDNIDTHVVATARVVAPPANDQPPAADNQ